VPRGCRAIGPNPLRITLQRWQIALTRTSTSNYGSVMGHLVLHSHTSRRRFVSRGVSRLEVVVSCAGALAAPADSRRFWSLAAVEGCKW
jgi:hypothetical protein